MLTSGSNDYPTPLKWHSVLMMIFVFGGCVAVPLLEYFGYGWWALGLSLLVVASVIAYRRLFDKFF